MTGPFASGLLFFMLLLLYILWQVRKLTREFRSYKISNSNMTHNELNEEDVKEIISEETSTPFKNLERGQFELFQKITRLTSKPPENFQKPLDPSPKIPPTHAKKVSFSEPNLKAKLFKKDRHDVISVNSMPIPNNPPIDLDKDSLPPARSAPTPPAPTLKRPKLVRSTHVESSARVTNTKAPSPPASVPPSPPPAPRITQRRTITPQPHAPPSKSATKPRQKLPTAPPSQPPPQLPSVQAEAVPQPVLGSRLDKRRLERLFPLYDKNLTHNQSKLAQRRRRRRVLAVCPRPRADLLLRVAQRVR